MSLDPHLLNTLTCPDCKLDVIYLKRGDKQELICPQCRRIFPVKDDTPPKETTKK